VTHPALAALDKFNEGTVTTPRDGHSGLGPTSTNRPAQMYIPVVSSGLSKDGHAMAIRFRPFIERDELLEQLCSSTATGDSALRRFRRLRVVTSGTSIRPRDEAGHLAGSRQVFLSLNVISVALERAGRRADAQRIAEKAAALEADLAADDPSAQGDYASSCKPGLPFVDGLVDWTGAAESLWATCRPEGTRELRGVVREVADGWAHLAEEGPHGRRFGIPVDFDVRLQAGDPVIVIQVKSGGSSWSSHVLPAWHSEPPDTEELSDERRLDTLYASSTSRERLFEQLAREAADSEPSSLTLLA